MNTILPNPRDQQVVHAQTALQRERAASLRNVDFDLASVSMLDDCAMTRAAYAARVMSAPFKRDFWRTLPKHLSGNLDGHHDMSARKNPWSGPSPQAKGSVRRFPRL